MPSSLPITIGLGAVLAFSLPLYSQVAAKTVRYGRDVRPILADRCFRCHGPDAAQRQAELRLDDRDDAVRPREDGVAIMPFSPTKSLLWQRVTAHDADERMPPAASGKPPLTAAELATIQAWIQEGAEYEPHWAFVPPTNTPRQATTSANPIDGFLASSLQQRGLLPSPEADPETLARRAFLVLTGLPPTPDELLTYRADRRSGAYERLVDRLLGEEPWRTRHAEHLAQMWLDAARYADTSGIHMDAGRQAWAWRDWLIAALRDDMPFDQFVVEQLAGDLLPAATQSQRIATGFLRNHVTTDEGGAIDEEYRIEYAAERTATVGSVFLGLTFGCARCHDHKYDPIRQEDYYRLFSFFNSNQEPGLYSQLPDSNRALEPFLAVPTPKQVETRTLLQQELATAERVLSEPSPDEQAALDAFQTAFAQRANQQWTRPTIGSATSAHGATMQVDAEGTVIASGTNPDRDEHVVTMTTTGGGQQWLVLEALPHADLPAGKVGRAPNGNAVLQHLRLEQRAVGASAWQRVTFTHALADVEQEDGDFVATNLLDDDDRSWAIAAHKAGPRPVRAMLMMSEPLPTAAIELRATLKYDSVYTQHTFGRVRFHLGTSANDLRNELPLTTSGFSLAGPFGDDTSADLYATNHGPESVRTIDRGDRWGKRAWRFDDALLSKQPNASLPKGRNVTYIGQRVHSPSARRVEVALGSDDGFQLFVNGKMVAERRVDRAVAAAQDIAAFDLPAGPSAIVLKVINTGGDGGFALAHTPRGIDLAGGLQLLALPSAATDAELRPRIADAFREQRSPHHKQRRDAVASLKKQLGELETAIPRAMVMDEKAARPTFVLMRGEYDKPDAARPVARELPQMFGPLPKDLPKDRLGLARWMVSPDNPLFLRVQANRLWEFVFGTGLVRTSEDFGHQGEWPSHPELLDALAVEFRHNGLSVQKLLRLLVTSRAFRQHQRVHPAAAAVDRDNRLLAWFPRRRLTAEAIRDQALFVSGLMVERVGGPSVKPYQPPGLWQEVAMLQSNTRLFEQGKGDDLWRRSLYTYWKRACPPPSLQTLDAPTRESCTIRRGTTNTPLQALVLWNDEQFVEAARALAQRTLRSCTGDDERLASMFLRCTGHALTGTAMARSKATLAELRASFTATPANAQALLAVGQSARADELPPAELAAFTVLANTFLNLDATLCID